METVNQSCLAVSFSTVILRCLQCLLVVSSMASVESVSLGPRTQMGRVQKNSNSGSLHFAVLPQDQHRNKVPSRLTPEEVALYLEKQENHSVPRYESGPHGGIVDAPSAGRQQLRAALVTVRPVSAQPSRHRLRAGETCATAPRNKVVHLSEGCLEMVTQQPMIKVRVNSCSGGCRTATHPVAVLSGSGALPGFKRKCRCCKATSTRTIKKYAMCNINGKLSRKTYTFITADSCGCRRC